MKALRCPELVEQITVVMTQRERFSLTEKTLNNLYATIDPAMRVIFVDGGSGDRSQSVLRSFQERYPKFEVIRRDHFLCQNQAYNLALEKIDTPFIAYLDNDVDLHPDWLSVLYSTIKEHGAAIASPLYLEIFGEQKLVHMGGGHLILKKEAGKWVYFEEHICPHGSLKEAESLPPVEETMLVEYHAFLIERDFLNEIGGFDPAFYNAKDPPDLCLMARARGRKMITNRTVWVAYNFPPPVRAEDRDFFRTRWSDEWTEWSYRHFSEKWGIEAPVSDFFGQQRRNYLFHFLLPLQILVGFRNARRIYYRLFDFWIAPIERHLNAKFFRKSLRLPESLKKPPVSEGGARHVADRPPAPLEEVFQIRDN